MVHGLGGEGREGGEGGRRSGGGLAREGGDVCGDERVWRWSEARGRVGEVSRGRVWVVVGC